MARGDRDRALARPAHDLDHHVRPCRSAEALGAALMHLRELQARTGGITEFVPLPFVPMEDANLSERQVAAAGRHSARRC